MAITSRSSRPSEWAAKTNHTHIINDPFVQSFLDQCDFPKENLISSEGGFDSVEDYTDPLNNPIKHILVIDGGYTSVEVHKNFPSSQLAFFQFGALMFQLEDLEELSEKPFIFPEDMQRLHDLQRFKLVLPTQNIKTKDTKSLTHSIRKAIYDFFMQERDSSSFMETLKWLIFEEYRTPKNTYILGNDPNLLGGRNALNLNRSEIRSDYTFETVNGVVYLTDIFRLHEAIDDDHGAMGILGYVTRLIEQMILAHFIKTMLKIQPSLLSETLFIVDGPLSFAGQTANMHKPLRELCNYLRNKKALFLVGVEKSGAFVEHAQQVCALEIIKQNQYLLVSNEHIYKYIIPGDSESMLYGSTSYYGGKVIFHSEDKQILILSVPIPNKDSIRKPKIDDYGNLFIVLKNIQKLRCAMYDDAIIPVALANKLVSLANHPSKMLLEKFANIKINS